MSQTWKQRSLLWIFGYIYENETARQTDDTVTSQPSTERLIHRTLNQERLDDKHKGTERQRLPEKSDDHWMTNLNH